MSRKQSKRTPNKGLDHSDVDQDQDTPAIAPPCWLCGRPTGKTIIWHHPIPKSRGGREIVPMHSVCQQTIIANFTNSELQRHGMNAQGLLENPNVRKFVDWVANKDPDFTATMVKKQR
jgi:hypothetical protein